MFLQRPSSVGIENMDPHLRRKTIALIAITKNSMVGGFEHHIFLINKEQCSQKLGIHSVNICLMSAVSQNVQEHLKFR